MENKATSDTAVPAANPPADPPAYTPAVSQSQHILSLPDEVLLSIFSFLNITNLPPVLDVCSRWRKVITSSPRWRTLDFTPVKKLGLHVKVAKAVGHHAQRVLGAAPLGQVAKRVLKNCPNLVELRMSDATIDVKILGDIIDMCPMMKSVETCVRVRDCPADYPTLMHLTGKVDMVSPGTAVNAGNSPSTQRSIYDIVESLRGVHSERSDHDRLLLHALSNENAIFCVLKQCRGRFTSLSLAAIVGTYLYASSLEQNPSCDVQDILGIFQDILSRGKFMKMKEMLEKTKVFFKYGVPINLRCD